MALPFKKLMQNKQNKLKVVILNQLKMYTVIYLVLVLGGNRKNRFRHKLSSLQTCVCRLIFPKQTH